MSSRRQTNLSGPTDLQRADGSRASPQVVWAQLLSGELKQTVEHTEAARIKLTGLLTFREADVPKVVEQLRELAALGAVVDVGLRAASRKIDRFTTEREYGRLEADLATAARQAEAARRGMKTSLERNDLGDRNRPSWLKPGRRGDRGQLIYPRGQVFREPATLWTWHIFSWFLDGMSAESIAQRLVDLLGNQSRLGADVSIRPAGDTIPVIEDLVQLQPDLAPISKQANDVTVERNSPQPRLWKVEPPDQVNGEVGKRQLCALQSPDDGSQLLPPIATVVVEQRPAQVRRRESHKPTRADITGDANHRGEDERVILSQFRAGVSHRLAIRQLERFVSVDLAGKLRIADREQRVVAHFARTQQLARAVGGKSRIWAGGLFVMTAVPLGISWTAESSER